MATTELGFKKPLSKEEMIEKKKQRLAAIGTSHMLILHVLLEYLLNYLNEMDVPTEL